MATFPIPIAPAWLLLYAMAMLGPSVKASLLPVFTSGIPPTEIASEPSLVGSVALVSADAVAVPTRSARKGAPAHIVTAPSTVFFIGVSFTLTPSMALVGHLRSFRPADESHAVVEYGTLATITARLLRTAVSGVIVWARFV